MPVVDRARVVAALPGYTVGRELGASEFGLVFAGQRTDDGREVAIRALSRDGTHDGAVPVGEFSAAAEVLRLLDHPHLAQVCAHATVDSSCLLVTELLAGGRLSRQYLSQQGACAVVLAVADALSHAHNSGILHLDIKPDNILFTAAGRPKVVDVGVVQLSRLFGNTTASGRLVGTPQYMAPEQIAGDRLSPATDVYALGITLYELLAGTPPFDPVLAVEELFRYHCEVPAPPPPGVAPQITRVVLRALEKNPAARYPTAVAFAIDLAAAGRAAYGPGWLRAAGIPLLLPPTLDESDAVDEPGTPGTPGTPSAPSAPGAGVPAVSERPGDETTQDLPPPTGPVPVLAPRPAAEAAPDPRTASPVSASADQTRHAGDPAVPAEPAIPAAGGTAPTAPGARSRRRGGRAGARRGPGWPVAAAVIVLVVACVGLLLTVGSGRDSGPERGSGPGPQAGPATPGTGMPTTPADPSVAAAAFPVTVVAGTGVPGFSGDGGPAGQAAFNTPYGPVLDQAGNLYVPDFSNHRIRRIGVDGVVTTVAGVGTPGFSGDGGPATEARLDSPAGVALDAAGNLYIADTFNHRIRRVDTRGVITTIAGSAEHGASSSEFTGPALEAELWYPGSVAVDAAGNLYFTDTGNNMVWRVDPRGMMRSFAGLGYQQTGSFGDGGPAAEALLGTPRGLAIDGAGNIYIADEDAHRIRRVDPRGVITTIAGTGVPGLSGDGGPATKAMLRGPRGVAVDAAGNVYIADRANARVRRVDARGVITTVAGGRIPTSKQDLLGAPDGQLAVDRAGNVYFAARGNNQISKILLGG